MINCLFIISFILLQAIPFDTNAQETERKLNSIFKFEDVYTGELFSNLYGGVARKEGVYRAKYDFTATVDLEKAGVINGGSFCVYFENGNGESITENFVGDLQVISNIDAHDFSQISEYYYTQYLFYDRLMLKFGKQDSNADFCVTSNSGDFINSSFGIIPNVPMPTFPNPSVGSSVFFSINRNLSIAGGVYDGAGRGGQWGFNTTFDSNSVRFSVAELGYSYSVSSQGRFKFGIWRHGGDYSEISGKGSKSLNSGVYLIIDQRIINIKSNGFTLNSFFQYGNAENSINEIPNYFGGGLKASGFFSKRNEDLFGIGFASAIINNNIPGMKPETAIELFYMAPIISSLTIQPDFQYIINPGGNGRNSLVAGMRFYIDI